MKLPCVICNCDVHFQDPKLNDKAFNDDDQVREQCKIFCKYFNLSPTQFECQSNDDDGGGATVCIFPSCQNCLMTLTRLIVLNEQVEFIQQNIDQIVANISTQIITDNSAEERKATTRKNVSKHRPGRQGSTGILQKSDGKEDTARKFSNVILSMRQIIRKQYSPSVIVQELGDRGNSRSRRRGPRIFSSVHNFVRLDGLNQNTVVCQKTVGAQEEPVLDVKYNFGEGLTDDKDDGQENYAEDLLEKSTCDSPSNDSDSNEVADSESNFNRGDNNDEDDGSQFSQDGEEDCDSTYEPLSNKKRRLVATTKKSTFEPRRSMSSNRGYTRVVNGKGENEGKLIWGKWIFEPTTNNGSEGFRCSCGVFKKTKKMMLCHFYYHEIVEKKKWTCKYCHRVCGSLCNLVKHERTHDNVPPELNGQLGSPTTVPVVGERSSRKSPKKKSTNTSSHVLGNKWRVNKLENGTFSCETCGTIEKSHFKVLQHVKTVHMEKEPLVCPIEECGKVVVNGLHEFLSHCKIHPTLTNAMIIPCGRSMFVYGDKWFFESISNGPSADNDERQFKCCACGLMGQTEEEIVDHLKNAHTNPQKHACPHCGQECKDKKHLNSHLRQHSRFDKNQDEWNNGDKIQYYDYKGTKWPFEMEELDGGKFHCRTGNCESQRLNLGNIQRHIRTVHAEPKKYVCEFCGAAFGNASYFRQHRTLHSSEPGAFICDICGATYKSMSLLRRHQQKHRLWKCEQCEATFAYKDGLGRHLKTPCFGYKTKFDCPHCQRCFKTEQSLAKHVTKFHPSDEDESFDAHSSQEQAE